MRTKLLFVLIYTLGWSLNVRDTFYIRIQNPKFIKISKSFAKLAVFKQTVKKAYVRVILKNKNIALFSVSPTQSTVQ